MASAAQQLLRADALLCDELARLLNAGSELTPAARATVRTVLASLAEDPELNPAVAAEVRRVLDVLLERPSPQHRHHRGLRTIRLRAA